MILSKVTKNAGLQSLSLKHTFGKSAGGGGGGEKGQIGTPAF